MKKNVLLDRIQKPTQMFTQSNDNADNFHFKSQRHVWKIYRYSVIVDIVSILEIPIKNIYTLFYFNAINRL